VLKAGIAHAHLVAIHPFADGNGRAARLLATLLLQKGGYGFRKLLSLDAHYQRNRDEYIGALRKSLGPKFHSQPDLTPWLDFFPLSMIVQAGWLEQRLTDWRMTVEMLHSQLAPLGLNERQVDGLVYAANLGHITRKDYAEITGISLLTATRDLAGMVAAGYLSPVGVGRNRKYVFRPPGEGEQGEAAQPNLL
jgi:Fic family protein